MCGVLTLPLSRSVGCGARVTPNSQLNQSWLSPALAQRPSIAMENDCWYSEHAGLSRTFFQTHLYWVPLYTCACERLSWRARFPFRLLDILHVCGNGSTLLRISLRHPLPARARWCGCLVSTTTIRASHLKCSGSG